MGSNVPPITPTRRRDCTNSQLTGAAGRAESGSNPREPMGTENFGDLEGRAVGAVDVTRVLHAASGGVLGGASEQRPRRSGPYAQLHAGGVVEHDGFQHRR